VARWFEGSVMAFAFGISLAFSRIGSSVNFAVTPILAEIGVPFSIWFGTATCALSFVACVITSLLDKWGEPKIIAKQRESKKEEVSFRFILRFPLSSWLIFLITLFFYVSVLTFYTVASTIIQRLPEEYSPNTASLFLFIPNFVAIFAAPALGKLVDMVGRALLWIMLACGMMVISQGLFIAISSDWFFIHPAIIMVWIGLGYSIFAASIWALPPFIIKEEMLGTAYGMMTSIQNLGLAVMPSIVGALQDSPGIAKTNWVNIAPTIIFMCCAGVALMLTFVLIGVDARRHQGVLNANGIIRQEAQRRLNEIPPEQSALIQHGHVKIVEYS